MSKNKTIKKEEASVQTINVEESKVITEIVSDKCSNVWKWIFIALAAIGLISIVCMSTGAGMSGDEHFHSEHAKNVYNYYATVGEDSTAAVITEDYNLP